METPLTKAEIERQSAEEKRLGCMPRWRDNWYAMRDHAEKLERALIVAKRKLKKTA